MAFDHKWNEIADLQSTTPFEVSEFNGVCQPDGLILDFGCGYGRTYKMLQTCGYTNIVGIDASPTLISRAYSSLRRPRLCIANITAVPFRDQVFDAGISLGVVNCLLSSRDLALFIEEAARVLKPGSPFYVNFYSRNASTYFDAKYKNDAVPSEGGRVFCSNAGLKQRHYSLVEFLEAADRLFDTVFCKEQQFLSCHQRRRVSGYTVILRKATYLSEFR